MKRIATFLILIIVTQMAVSKVRVINLTVEGRDTPIGIDIKKPRLGWQIESNEKNVKQTHYRIIVSSSKDKAEMLEGDIWDTGEVNTDQSQWVSFVKKCTEPNKEYFWRVQVKTNKGISNWSHIGKWSTGLLDDKNWKGYWIGIDSLMPWDSKRMHTVLAARYLRKEFKTEKEIVRATAHICGLGIYTLYINGEKVGDDELTPVGTDFTKSVIYNTYDVTSLIKKENVIGTILEAGNYFAVRQGYPSDTKNNVHTNYKLPRMLMNLIIQYIDGTSETIVTDDTWRLNADGAIRKANFYDGETYDARKEFIGWKRVGFDDTKWMQAQQVSGPGGKLTGNLTPSMHVYSTDKPVDVVTTERGFLLDFGTNGAGRIRLTIKGNYGDTIAIRYAEVLEKGDTSLYMANMRTAQCVDTFFCASKPQIWTSEYVYHGFRYVEILGMKNLPNDVVRELIADRMADEYTDFEIKEVGESGFSMINAIISNARRSIRSNYKGMPIDCPQRDERLPWLGDRTVGCLGESYMMNNHALYTKWVKDICEGQNIHGDLSDVSPTYWKLYRTNVTWPAALPFSADMLYRQYGDIQPMRNSYDCIKKWLAYIKKTIYQNNLIIKGRYGDWCVPPEREDLVFTEDPERMTDDSLLNSLYYGYICDMMGHYASIFGIKSDVDYYQKEAENTFKAINDTFLADDHYSNNTVTANLIPLAMKIIPICKEEVLNKNLIDLITKKYDTHISCGVIGMQWLMRYLSDSGNGNIAYALATQDEYPSLGYMVKNGATTIWELWNGNTANPSMNSANHVMLLGDFIPWCYEYLAGIRPAKPGFKEIELKPEFNIDKIQGVNASHPSPYGLIKSSWEKKEGKKILWRITIPTNTTATLYLPDGSIEKVGSGNHEYIRNCLI